MIFAPSLVYCWRFDDSTATRYLGLYQAGNCPGQASFNDFVFGPGDVSNYIFEIDDATGTAGPTADSSNHLDGNSLIKAKNLAWNATADNPLVINLMTLLNPSTPGTDNAGAMDNFDDTKPYSWTLAQWTGAYTGPTDDASLDASVVFNTAGFVNSFNGTLALHLDASAGTLSLTYTPNPQSPSGRRMGQAAMSRIRDPIPVPGQRLHWQRPT